MSFVIHKGFISSAWRLFIDKLEKKWGFYHQFGKSLFSPRNTVGCAYNEQLDLKKICSLKAVFVESELFNSNIDVNQKSPFLREKKSGARSNRTRCTWDLLYLAVISSSAA